MGHFVEFNYFNIFKTAKIESTCLFLIILRKFYA